ncbi:MAG: conditioned medium factor [Verrucomicrobia bacterium]|nr:conditioned medium factor [Verrucomicrobiota bacterium]
MKNLLIFTLAASAVPAFVQAAPPDSFKNLAGTADEMSAMRLPNPEAVGVRSKTAMLPVRFRGGKWTADLPIESTEDLRLTLLAPDSPTWQVTVRRGAEVTNLRGARTHFDLRQVDLGLDGMKYPAEVFSFKQPKAGIWSVEIEGPASAKRDGETAGFLVLTHKSPYQIYSYVDTHETVTGRSIGLHTRPFDTRTQLDAGSAVTATAEIGLTNGFRETVALRDNGNGSFSVNYVPRLSGEYSAQITVRGQTPGGEAFVRTSELLFQVVDSAAAFGKAADATHLDDTRLQVNVPVSGLEDGKKVIAYAEVWGTNASGQKAPVAWIGGMAVAEGGKLPLVLDGRWVARGEAKSGFELRTVRIQDPDYFVTLAQSDRLALRLPALPAGAVRSALGAITEDMRMGKRPTGQVVNAVGGKLMLVHGYCSGSNPWPPAQFASNIVFLDANKSRTHDQFANLIKTFGASYPSYGIVAHSQGGCASLHLYTYYWSGLDSATGTRLIQSVGTPYQGTALAGNLAALGSIFGAGCGSNQNLTYSGAASWLAGIPTWARAKVHFATTSFNDGWGYDYCNIATDLFLSDPDDGVVEKAYAQLSGANNRGHKTGWCHTSGMRDPAQTSDSSRNADMNTNAAR